MPVESALRVLSANTQGTGNVRLLHALVFMSPPPPAEALNAHRQLPGHCPSPCPPPLCFSSPPARPPCWPANVPRMLLPQGLCTGCPLYQRAVPWWPPGCLPSRPQLNVTYSEKLHLARTGTTSQPQALPIPCSLRLLFISPQTE